MTAPPGEYIVVEWSGGGGIGHYSFLLADALAGAGLDVVLATRSGHELLGQVPQRARVVALWPRAPRRLTGRLRRAAIALGWAAGWSRLVGRTLRARLAGRPAIVHVHAPETAAELVFLVMLRVTAERLVVTAHNATPHDAPRLGRAIHRATYRIPQTIIAQNDAEAATVRRIAGRRATVGVIPHGTYGPIADAFSVAPTDSGDIVRVAHLGSLRPYKGFDVVVDAFREALEEDEDLRLRVVGRASDDAEVRTLMSRVPSGAATLDLRYLSVEELVTEARGADALLLGHRRASESGILHLALAAGTPVVGPDIAGIGRLLASRPEWLYPPGDAHAAARAVVQLARRTRDDRAAQREAAHAIAEASAPTWDSVAAAHLDLLGITSESDA